VTQLSIQELVRKDLLWHEQMHSAYDSGSSAILDAYEEALSLCCYLRQVIEDMKIGPAAAGYTR
jgi:hypothetical protein